MLQVPCPVLCCPISGGPDMDTLFITTRGPDGGALYSVKVGGCSDERALVLAQGC